MSKPDDQPETRSDRAAAIVSGLGPKTVRSGENPLKHWILLSGNRLAVTAVLLLATFVALVMLSMIRPVDMRKLVNETTAARTLFSTLLGGAILLVSIVASINSTALSQEITDIEQQHERINASLEYRRQTEQLIAEEVSPARPAEFLGVILETIARQSQALRDAAANNPDDRLRRTADAFVSEVAGDLEHARRILRVGPGRAFDVILAGLSYNYAGQLHAARRFRREFDESLSEDERAGIDDLVETLEFYATAREYFKSLYYERELAKLSSELLYVSLPVIVFTSYVILAVDGEIVPEMSIASVTLLQVFISFAYTVSLAPYVILTAYIVRLSTITLRTLASGPFIFNQDADIDVFEQNAAEDVFAWDLPEIDD